MMSKYVKSVLNRKNEFRVDAEFVIFNTKVAVSDLKIDTGCGFTTFPLKTLGVFTDLEVQKFKKDDIASHVPYKISYGVETGGQKHSIPQTLQDMMDCKALGFFKEIFDFHVCGVNIRNRKVRINYDRTGNLLLGMDVLKEWDIHIGTIDTGETIFLGCPKDQINSDYLQELESTFHTTSSFLKA